MPQGGERAGASRALQASLLRTGFPDLENQTAFALQAEASGIEALLLDFGWAKPDPVLLAAATRKNNARPSPVMIEQPMGRRYAAPKNASNSPRTCATASTPAGP